MIRLFPPFRGFDELREVISQDIAPFEFIEDVILDRKVYTVRIRIECLVGSSVVTSFMWERQGARLLSGCTY